MPQDLSKLQGTWFIKSLEADGQKMEGIAASGAKIIVKGDKFISLGMGAEYEGKVTINEKAKPKSFDLLFTKGHAKGTLNLGIYKLTNDQWTICLATRGTTRPKKFATAAQTGLALEVLVRDIGKSKVAKNETAQPAKKSAKENHALQPSASGPATALEGEWDMVSAVFNGAPLNDEMVKWCKRITRGNVTTVMAGPSTMLKASFTLDTSKRPHTIEYMNLAGAGKGKPQSGIVELSGADLKICMSASGNPRPTDFSSKSGDGRSYTTWRFNKK